MTVRAGVIGGIGWLLLVASCGGDGDGGDDTSDGGSAGRAIGGAPSSGGSSGTTGGAGGDEASDGGSAGGDATGGLATAGAGGDAAGGLVTAGAAGAAGGPGDGDVTVVPTRIDDVLVNPGMGLANFHFGWWCNLPPVDFSAEDCAARTREQWPAGHPDSGTAYFRWTWRDLEPQRGEIAFDLLDRAIESANALGETLAFRVMTIADDDIGIPDWLQSITEGRELPSPGGTTYWPDYRDATFQQEHARFAAALAARYDGHPAVDHVDIGSAGCWGEWNTACLTDGAGLFGVYEPTDAADEQAIADAYRALIDAYAEAFADTPLVMLGLGAEEGPERDVFVHAIQAGTGWRVDCWGDWGIFGDTWNHQTDSYPSMIAGATAAFPAFVDTWQHAPIQLEVCGTLPEWAELGWTAAAPDGEVYRSFQWALDQHASVLNAKWTEIPEAYADALDDLLVRNGYRFVVDRLVHPAELAAGDDLTLTSTWSNLGVAPAYVPRTLSYRIRNADRTVTAESDQDLREWLPGAWEVTDTITLPGDLPGGTYEIEVGLVDRAGEAPATAPLPPLRLGIAGRGDDGWYALSRLTVR